MSMCNVLNCISNCLHLCRWLRSRSWKVSVNSPVVLKCRSLENENRQYRRHTAKHTAKNNGAKESLSTQIPFNKLKLSRIAMLVHIRNIVIISHQTSRPLT